MSNYDHRLILTLPADMLDIGRSIARALDPDTGGYESFTPDTVEGNIVSYTADTPCTEQFYQGALYMLDNPEALYQKVIDDYSARWGDLVPPTLEDCQLFCSRITVLNKPEEA